MALQCQEVVSYLSDFIDNQLTDDLAQAMREHVATCKNCHVVLDSTQRTIILYRERGQRESLTPRRHDALYAQLAQALATRKADDCE